MIRTPPPLLLLLGALLGAACARPQAPPGGDPDRQPPALVATAPAPLSLLSDLAAPVVVRFDERLRVRTFNRTFVTVMPGAPAEMEVSLHGAEIRVRRTGGWLPGQVYHVVVRAGLEDRFGNKRTDPVELVFSTGPEIPPTALAGVVQDRMTGQGARDAVVEAVRQSDSTTYRAQADSTAFFALRHAPYGTYDVRAYTDRNRNGRLDAGESRSEAVLVSMAPGADTTTLALELLPGDTTPPRLLRAETLDSLHVRLTFDDAIDLEFGLDSARVSFLRLADSATIAIAARLQPARAHEQEQQRARAAADSARAAEAARADTTLAATDTAAPPVTAPPRAPGVTRGAASAPGRLVPEPAVVVTLPAPLAPGEYAAQATGFRNLNRLSGGGTAEFTVQPPRPPADSSGRRP